MGYKLPKSLQDVSDNLQYYLNKELGRYQSKPYEVLVDATLKLEAHYRDNVKKKTYFLTPHVPDEARLKEIACITFLVLHLPKTDPNTFKRFKVHNIVLGALFYRRMARENTYQRSLLYTLTLGGWTEKASALYLSIESILGLDDKNKIDPLTVFTCCSAYKECLEKIKADDKKNYIPESEADLALLDTIISESKVDKRYLSFSLQMDYVVSIESVAKLIKDTDQKMRPSFMTFKEKLLQALKLKEVLLNSDLIACLESCNFIAWKNIFFKYLIPKNTRITKENLDTFIDDRQVELTHFNQYILLGAYVMVLKHEPIKDEQPLPDALIKVLKQAIDSVRADNELDDKTCFKALKVLNSYLMLPSFQDSPFYYSFHAWGGFSNFRAKVKEKFAFFEQLNALLPVSSSSASFSLSISVKDELEEAMQEEEIFKTCRY